MGLLKYDFIPNRSSLVSLLGMSICPQNVLFLGFLDVGLSGVITGAFCLSPVSQYLKRLSLVFTLWAEQENELDEKFQELFSSCSGRTTSAFSDGFFLVDLDVSSSG